MSDTGNVGSDYGSFVVSRDGDIGQPHAARQVHPLFSGGSDEQTTRIGTQLAFQSGWIDLLTARGARPWNTSGFEAETVWMSRQPAVRAFDDGARALETHGAGRGVFVLASDVVAAETLIRVESPTAKLTLALSV